MRCLLAVAVALLIAPNAAGAKGIIRADVCGRDTCTDLLSVWSPALVEGSFVSGSRSSLGLHYQLRFVMYDDRFTTRFVPATGLVRNSEGRWMRMSPAVEALLADATADLEPFGRQRSFATWLMGLLQRFTAT